MELDALGFDCTGIPGLAPGEDLPLPEPLGMFIPDIEPFFPPLFVDVEGIFIPFMEPEEAPPPPLFIGMFIPDIEPFLPPLFVDVEGIFIPFMEPEEAPPPPLFIGIFIPGMLFMFPEGLGKVTGPPSLHCSTATFCPS